MKNIGKILKTTALLVMLALGGVVGLYAASSNSAAPEAAPVAMPVTVTVIKPEVVQVWKNFSGHVLAVDQAEIRPQISGRITEIHFEDGQHVEKGDLLITIDPRPYESALAQAKAALEAAKAKAALAEKEYKRARELIKTQAVSQRLLDERSNQRQMAAAEVQGAQALLESAEVDLDYAYVKAPISGKVSRAEITEGNLVQAGPGAPLLTSIVSDEKLYVDFEVDDQTYINSVRHARGAATKTPVRVSLPGGSGEYTGTVESFDNRIDPETGTIRARAVFDNPEKILLPGMSVSVLMGEAADGKQILVSERAIGTDQDRKFVYVVDDQNQAAYREIKIGESIEGRRIVFSGLEEGDKVITEGIMRIRPGIPVDPQVDAGPGDVMPIKPAGTAAEKDKGGED